LNDSKETQMEIQDLQECIQTLQTNKIQHQNGNKQKQKIYNSKQKISQSSSIQNLKPENMSAEEFANFLKNPKIKNIQQFVKFSFVLYF
jgi:hypothetical protein